MKLILMTVSLVFMSFSGVAGIESGGGGDTFVCYTDYICLKETRTSSLELDSQIVDNNYCKIPTFYSDVRYRPFPKGKFKRNFLKDTKEWNELNSRQIRRVGALNLAEVFSRTHDLIKPFERINKDLFETLQHRLSEFEGGGLVFSKDSVLEEVDDSSAVIHLKQIDGLTCFEKQLAIQQFKETSDIIPMLRIDQEYFKALDGMDQIGLLVHEALYYAFSKHFSRSDRVRPLVGKILSGEFAEMKESARVAYLIKNGLFPAYTGDSSIALEFRFSGSDTVELSAVTYNGERVPFKLPPSKESIFASVNLKKGDDVIEDRVFGCDFNLDYKDVVKKECSVKAYKVSRSYSGKLVAILNKTVAPNLTLAHMYKWPYRGMLTTHIYYKKVLISYGFEEGLGIQEFIEKIQVPLDLNSVVDFRHLTMLMKKWRGTEDFDTEDFDKACGKTLLIKLSSVDIANFMDKGILPSDFIKNCKFDLLDGVPYPVVEAKDKHLVGRTSLTTGKYVLFIDEKAIFSAGKNQKVKISFKALSYEQGRYRMMMEAPVGLFNRSKAFTSFDFKITEFSPYYSGYGVKAVIEAVQREDARITNLGMKDNCGELVSGQTFTMSNSNWSQWLELAHSCN